MLTLEPETEAAQERLGARLSAALDGGCVIFLHGDLGAGKTTLARGFLRGLGYQGAVKSPTYTLMEPYELDGRPIYHLDLYRLADPGELEYLGLRDLLTDAAVLLVEWPEKGEDELPPPDLVVDLTHQPNGRRLTLSARSETGRRLLGRLVAA